MTFKVRGGQKGTRADAGNGTASVGRSRSRPGDNRNTATGKGASRDRTGADKGDGAGKGGTREGEGDVARKAVTNTQSKPQKRAILSFGDSDEDQDERG